MPQKAKPKRLLRPPQHQRRQPGIESKMRPAPRAAGNVAGFGRRLDGRVAVITGGGRGTGGRVANAFVDEGGGVATAAAAGEAFQVEVPLASGPNFLTAVGYDAAGNESVSSEWILLIVNEAPAAVTGLSARLDGRDGVGTGNEATDGDRFGYLVERDGTPLLHSSAQTSAETPCVMKFFDPLITHPPSRRKAIVFIPEASDPEPGSVNPHAPSFSPLARGVTYFLS